METATPLALADAEALAERTLAAMDGYTLHSCLECPEVQAADRERVASDLEGLQEHDALDGPADPPWCQRCESEDWPCPDARRYLAGLRRTAALYDVVT